MAQALPTDEHAQLLNVDTSSRHCRETRSLGDPTVSFPAVGSRHRRGIATGAALGLVGLALLTATVLKSPGSAAVAPAGEFLVRAQEEGETCENLGCGKQGKDCACNPACHTYGDCCEDYKSFCAVEHKKSSSDSGSADTCAELKCGGRSETCACNSACAQYDDCCEDFEDMCAGVEEEHKAAPAKHQGHQKRRKKSDGPELCKDLACGSRGQTCDCTSQCKVFEHCCEDFEDTCGAAQGVKAWQLEMTDLQSGAAPHHHHAAKAHHPRTDTKQEHSVAPKPATPPKHQKEETSACREARLACVKAVEWARTSGFYEHPKWYPGLSATSTPDEFKALLVEKKQDKCDEVC